MRGRLWACSLAAATILMASPLAKAQCVEASKKIPRPEASGGTPGLTTITFSGYPAGTAISTQYESQGIVFSGDSPYIIYNVDNEYVGYALVGNPPCHGTVTGKFVDPVTFDPSSVDQVQVQVAGFNDIGATQVSFYSQSGELLSAQLNENLGVETFSYSSSNPRIGSWSVVSVAEDTYGWGVVSVTYDTPTNLFMVDPYLVSGASSGTIPVASVVSSIGDYANVQALGLVADGSSAMIAVVPTAAEEAVDFLISGDATLAPYNPTFLESAPVAGTGSLTVPASSLYKAPGGGYYALALVESTGTATLSGTPGNIAIDAFPSGGLAKANVPVAPPPVVFVHGLWGNSASLSNVISGLQATEPWSGWANPILEPICYSKYIGFNATSDPVPNNGDPCEYTPEYQMADVINYIHADMDVNHIAGGGRADIVAHSMGGLVARSFSGTSEYKGLRDRGLGIFRMVVTIDTPETGSSIATFLVNNSTRAYNSSNSIAASLAWKAKCSTTDTLASCLTKIGNPLAGPGQPLTTGAVYSLEPGGPAIASAPSPQIPNAQWRAVNAVWSDTTSPYSLLRGVLNELLAATYASNAAIPTLSSILGASNDVIVTQSSQTAGASASQTASFTTLAHTGTPLPSVFLGLASFLGYQDYNVLNSYNVNTVVACWLKSAGSNSCPSMVAEEPARPPAPLEELPAKPNFDADGRIAAEAPDHKVALAAPFELPIRVLAPGVQRIVISQSDARGPIPFGDGVAKILREDGNRQILEVTPLRLGKIEVQIMVVFSDGGVASQNIELNVEPPATAPQHFQADKHSIRVLIAGSNDHDRAILEPSAKYAGVPNAIPLDYHSVQYILPASDVDPVIEIHDGVVKALRVGETVVEAHYGDAVDKVRVMVKPADWR